MRVAWMILGILVAMAVPLLAETEVLIVVGPSRHPPGTHEVAAGGRVMAHCLESAGNVDGIRARVVYEWPSDSAVLEKVATVVFTGDQFPGARLEGSEEIMVALGGMVERGCGIVCVHYATGLGAGDVDPEGEHPLLEWTGGYFATKCAHHQSVAAVFEATITPAAGKHPVMRGWETFEMRDEPYTRNWFGKKRGKSEGLASGGFALATTSYPPAAPVKEVIAWGIERADGGRGVGITMPHFFRNWEVEALRMFVLISILWTAKLEVP